MIKHQYRLLLASVMSMMLVLAGCSGDGGGDSSQAETTTVSGKVSLSSVVSKAREASINNKALIAKAMRAGKPGSKAYQKVMADGIASELRKSDRTIVFSEPGAAFSNGIVYLYDAGHPEWKFPVAEATTDSLGDYELTVTANAAKNGNAYADGIAIPAGKYTLLAISFNGLFPDLVALQAVVNEFDGAMTGLDLVAQRSTAKPIVTTMLGVSKNTDGTQTWGDSSLELAPNAAVQISFSMPMFREALTDTYLKITEQDGTTDLVPAGEWTLSADWLTATYYLNDGETWEPGTTYEVTVMGSDGDLGIAGAIYNIFGKFLEESGTGTFSVLELAAGQTLDDLIDDVSPTATLISPAAQTGVEVIEPIRIRSNERMDVNGLLLSSTPSLGAQPGVLLVGKVETEITSSTGSVSTKVEYDYEFVLGEPLKLGTTYDIVVSGGKDLAGNVMNSLNTSFQTVAASEGITPLGDDATEAEILEVNAQVDVKDVFGKWIRSMNDRNIPQLQSLMTGDFFMEYNASNGFEEADQNRDGMYDLAEFSEMMKGAFTFWDYCGVTVSGSIPSDINITAGGDLADFEFVLSGTSSVTNQECKEAVPQDSLYATLQKINGGWFMVRASDGIDTRGQEVTAAAVIELIAPADGDVVTIDDINTAEFSWAEVDGAASYALIMIDSRNSKSGFSVIVPPTQTSIVIPTDVMFLFEDDVDSDTMADISADFGFTDGFNPRNGSELYWQVAALGSNTVADVQNERQTSIPKDVTAMSSLNTFKLAGEYQELAKTVYSNDGAPGTAGADSATPVTFSELIWGYDLGAANWATIEFTSPRVVSESLTNHKGVIFVDGNTHKEYCVDFDANGVGSATIELNEGVNHIGLSDDASRSYECNPGGTAGGDGGGNTLEDWFQITTTGGIAPLVTISSVKGVNAAGTETALTNDGWDFYNGATDSVKLIIAGSVDCTIVDCMNMHDMNINLWNDQSHANANSRFNADSSTGDFTVEMEIYTGENWINIHGGTCDNMGMCQNFNANFGVKTDAGAVYVPPISAIAMTDAGTAAAVDQQENWGNGGMWNASAVVGNVVTISGMMEFPTDNSGQNRTPRYDVGSDGGWMSEDINVAADGSFSIDVTLFHGWNYVNIQDANDNWYHLDVLTDLGEEVVRPEILTVNGAAFTGTEPTVDVCTVELTGTAMAGQMYVYWNGNKGGEHFWDEVKAVAAADDTFSVTVPLVGGANTENFIDVFDQNWNWMGTRVINSNEACNYAAPTLTVTGVVDAANAALVELNGNTDMYGGWADYGIATGDYSPVPTTSVSVSGTSNVAGRTITAELYGCGGVERYSAVAADTVDGSGEYPWTVSGITVYEGYNGIGVSNGPQWFNVNVNATNSNPVPPPAIAVTIAGATTQSGPEGQLNCNHSQWDSGTAAMVTVSGTTTGSDGQGEYHWDGGYGTFTITNGAFSFDVELYAGSNYIGINDADWNYHDLNIQSSSTTTRPQFVMIDTMTPAGGSPVAFDPTMMPSGTVTISGTIINNPDGGSNFMPTYVGAGVDLGCDPTGMCNWGEFSSDPGADWAQPLTLTPSGSDYTFSFDVTFEEDPNNAGKANRGWINVWADQMDSTGMWIEGHGMDTPINDAGCTGCGGSWKPGKSSKQQMSLQNRMRMKAARSKGK